MITGIVLATDLSLQQPAPNPRNLDGWVRYGLTARSETPLPATCAPELKLPTTSPVLAQDDATSVARLVSDAHRVTVALAVLPADPEDEALIDRLIASRPKSTVRRPLPRR